jgi:antitoxin component YwqK of YwqJK toxin-antitoxin module
LPAFYKKNTPLKTNALSGFLLLFLSLFLVSFSDPYTIKRISDTNFRYEFYTTDKKIKIKEHKVYFWFKGGAIHNAESGIAGTLLHDKFVKMYHSNQLAEQGQFEEGLKVGLWKTWHQNGTIETTQKWKNGLKSGEYLQYDENGTLTACGKYTKGLKTGKWINFESNDTLVYKKGTIVLKKQKISKSQEYKLKEEQDKLEKSRKKAQEQETTSDLNTLESYKAATKEKEKTAKEQKTREREKEKAARKEKKAAEKASGKESKTTTFFKSLFTKKQ